MISTLQFSPSTEATGDQVSFRSYNDSAWIHAADGEGNTSVAIFLSTEQLVALRDAMTTEIDARAAQAVVAEQEAA